MIYNYWCNGCNEKRKVECGIREREKQVCDCGQDMIQYIIPSPAIFKGSGWSKNGIR